MFKFPDAGGLSGRRVRLEPLGPQHADALLAAATEDRATYDFTTVPHDRDHMAEYIRELVAERAAGTACAFAQIRLVDDVPVGGTRYLEIRDHAVEIGGTWLAASAQRTGINVEAKLLLLTHAFETARMGRVDFKTDARNQRSRDAITALGATFEGVLRNWQPSHAKGEEGRLRDSAMFSITDAEWPAVKAGLNERLRT